MLVTVLPYRQVYDAANWTLLCQTSVKTSCFMAGKFLDAKTVLLQLRNGCVYLYNVPFQLDTPPNARNDLPLNMHELSSLESQNDDTRCHTVLMDQNELTVVFGYGCGKISVLKSHLPNGQDHFNGNFYFFFNIII